MSLLDLEPHPEGGYFRETFRSTAGSGGRAASTAIYFLVTGEAPSCLHRVDADEVFHHYAGAPVEQLVIDAGGGAEARWLGTDWQAGQRPQAIVPAGAWQGCRVTVADAWALLGCTVAPGFDFSGFQLADSATADALRRSVPEHAALIDALRPARS